MFGWTYNFEDENVWSAIFEDSLPIVASLVLFIPIEIRRATDAGLSLWTVLLVNTLLLIPSPPDSADGHLWAAYLLVVTLPVFVYYIVLQFKPGKAFREWSRSRL